VAQDGFAAALLLDARALLGRADLRADEEAVRRWIAAAALVRGADAGGQVVVVADAAMRAVQALVRWDPVGFAVNELAERQALGLPPARRFVSVTGEAEVLAEFRSVATLPEGTDAFGPVARPTRSGESLSAWVLAAPPRRESELAACLHQTLGQLTVRKRPVPRVHVDPVDLMP
jgi:primosomal protein N' (replication factor Y)